MSAKGTLLSTLLVLAVSSSHAILGGENVKQGEYPFVAALVRPGYTDCAATILTKDWLLTQGFCCFLTGNQFQAHVGTVSLKKGGKLVDIDSYILHPEWGVSDDAGLTMPNNICLVKLKNSLKFNKNIQQVTLPPADYPFADATNVSALGWGAKNDSYWATTNRLKIIKDLSAYPSNCPGITSVVPFVGMMCASNPVGQSPCDRDEGGPLLYKDYIQIGLFNYHTNGYCSISTGGIYVRIAHYVPWIQAALGKEVAAELKIASYKEVPCRFTYCSPW